MRILSVEIENYKNLNNFSLPLDSNSLIDVFVGKNGSGKSNLFEALIKIFNHLDEYDRTKVSLDFSYSISYEIEGKTTEIKWDSEQFEIDGKPRKTIGKTPLPDNVLIYYSGHNDTVAGLVKKYEDDFSSRIRSANPDESRRFIGIGPEYKQILLTVLLLQPDASIAKRFICQKLGIQSVDATVSLRLKRPVFASKSVEIDVFDPNTHFWGTEGITKQFLDDLIFCIKGAFSHADLYSREQDSYDMQIDTKLFSEKFSDTPATDIFRMFDNLKTLQMIADVDLPLKLANGLNGRISHFSDGQFQSVYIYSIVELFKDRNCMTLLDEPDSFLHPEWQFDFLKQVFEVANTESQKMHVLMSSHSASTLCNFGEPQINLFKIEGNRVSCDKRTKKDVINELSNSIIQYSEDESNLLINNVIRSSLRPILFVEGPSDVSILNTAYTKLFPGRDIPILIQDAFDRGFLKILLSRDDIFRTYPDKHFFALFDFDDAYEDWRDLNGTHVVADVGLGLCKKLDGKHAHALLLPIPDNELRSQVWDEANPVEKLVAKPCFGIEHIFWDVPELNDKFKEDKKTKKIVFKGDKIKFAQNVVPTFDSNYFESFRPMFDLIHEKAGINLKTTN